MKRRTPAGFSLVEVLVTFAILALVLTLMLKVVGSTGDSWKNTGEQIEAFKGARLAFQNLTRLLEQATLNTYWDYDNPAQPTRYLRKSELHFVSDQAENLLPQKSDGTAWLGHAVFFQAPANKTALPNQYDSVIGLLNACGFFVEYGSDDRWNPPHIQESRNRFRLMQWVQNTENLAVYTTSDASWINPAIGNDTFPIAENVIALLLWPKESGDTSSSLNSYRYDSRYNANANPQPVQAHQLPPVVQVAMVAIDERSALRLGDNLYSVISNCMAGLFTDQPAEKMQADLDTLKQRLLEANIRYQVFFSSVPLREAKWSRQP